MRLKVKIKSPIQNNQRRGDVINVAFSLYNPYPFSVDFKDKTFPVSICACFFTKKIKQVSPIVSNVTFSVLKPHKTLSGEMYTVVPQDIPFGEYTFSFTSMSIFGPALENEMFKMKISE